MKLFYLLFIANIGFAQSADSLLNIFEKNHQKIIELPCASGQIATNRALNLYMADRVGYYLASDDNLSYCKNNLTFNTATGQFAMTHSLFEPKAGDNALDKFLAIGLRTKVFEPSNPSRKATDYGSELGATIKQFWTSKPKITLNNCNEKLLSDAYRGVLLNNLTHEHQNKSTQFETNLAAQVNLNDSLKNILRYSLGSATDQTMSRKYAEAEFENIFRTMPFKKITMHWTNLSAYIPIMLKRSEFNGDYNKFYPAEIALNHTRFAELHNATKLYWNLRFSAFADATYNYQLVSNYFQKFLSTTFSTQMVYFPPQNHFGISAKIEQTFGQTKALNGTIGIPVVLINKQSYASSNFEVQIHYFDLQNNYKSSKPAHSRVYLGLSFGQPIGRNVY